MKIRIARAGMAVIFMLVFVSRAAGQTEVNAWGGLRGIRVDGELLAFTTGIRAALPGAPIVQARGERLGFVQFERKGDDAICSGELPLGSVRYVPTAGQRPPGKLSCTIRFHDTPNHLVNVDVEIHAGVDLKLRGIYFFVHLPRAEFEGAELALRHPIPLSATQPSGRNVYLEQSSQDLEFRFARGSLQLDLVSPQPMVVEEDRSKPDHGIDVYFPLCVGNLSAGQNVQATITFKATLQADHSAAKLALDFSRVGSPFAGVGGNFRIQSEADPAYIQYNLDHLRIAWARVAMPLNLWQREEGQDPVHAAETGKIDPNVSAAMEMAGKLARKHIPLIISVWFAPDWALEARDPSARFRSRKINPRKWDGVCASIASYLQYLKAHYGAEPRLFSFNESNIGIDILQSAQEHEETIKRLGGYFAAHGLTTKMLLGDTGDAPPIDFIGPALADPDAKPFVGAVSFHSWHGGTGELYSRWGAAARKLGVPLLVAEGGTDSDSYAYPSIFLEPWYGLEEISQYVLICRTAQPLSILQWQITKDYALLSGGNGQPLKPTQRFWNLAQLNFTPSGSQAVDISCDKDAIVACAFRDAESGIITVHLVNNGAKRDVEIAGFPASEHELHPFITDETRGAAETPIVPINAGVARLTLDSQSYTTLMTTP
jgi:hypothetical protein